MMVVERTAAFRSLAQLQNRHMELLSQSEHAEDDDTFLGQLESFVQAGRATGRLLEEPADRRSAQSMLDYWTAVLYRTRRESGPRVLEDFDPSVGAGPLREEDCPYPGLRPFREADAQYFSGRELLITELAVRLRARRLLAICGPASSGKTSLVLAGLLPALKAGRLEGSAGWHYFEPVTPGTAPLRELALQLVALDSSDLVNESRIADEIDALRNNPGHLRERVRPVGSSVLVVDQLEAVLASEPGDGQALLANLVALAEDTSSDCSLIVIARSGGNDTGVASATLLAADVSAELPPLGARELRDAIIQPAEAVGLRFEHGLVSDLVRTLVAAPSSLPMLQFVLRQLWSHRQQNRVSLATYRELLWDNQRNRANPPSSLGRAAQRAYDGCRTPADRERARRILLSLVETGDSWDLQFNRVRRAALAASSAETVPTNRVLNQFVQAGVIRLSDDGDADNPNVELTHESLPRYWEVLGGWLHDERERHMERLLTIATATDWDKRGRPGGALWHGSRLRAALRFGEDANPTVRAFIKLSVRSDRNRRWRYIGAAFVSATLLALGLGTLGVQQVESEHRANSRQLAAQADLVANTHMDLALLLSLNAYQLEPTAEARSALLSALETNPFTSAIMPDEQHARALAMSPDGRWLAAGNEDGSILVWPTAERTAPRVFAGPRSTSVQTLAFSSDGMLLAATFASSAGGGPSFETWSVWDGSGRTPAAQPPAGFTALASATSARGEIALLGAREVQLGDLESDLTPFRSIPLSGDRESSKASSVAFSRDGGLLVTAACVASATPFDTSVKCKDGAVSIFDTTTFKLRGRLQVAAPVTSLDVGRSDQFPLLVAAGLADGSSMVWGFDELTGEIGTANIVQRTTADGWTVKAVALNRDGDRLLLGRCRPVENDRCIDGGFQIWDTATEQQVQQPVPGRIDNSQYFAFSRTGDQVAMADSERVTLWNVRQRDLAITSHVSAQPSAGTVARSAATGVLASARCIDPTQVCRGAVQLSTMDGLLPGARPERGIASLAFDDSGSRLAAGGGDGTISLWDVASARQLDPRQRLGDAEIWALAFSHGDGADRLAIAHDGDRISFWDTRTNSVTDLPPAKVGLRSTAFSPDNKLLAAGTIDGRILVWDVATQRLIVPPLTGHVGWVRILAFAQVRELRLLASVDRNNFITVWDVDAGRPLAYPPNLNPQPVTSVELLEEPGTQNVKLITHDADSDSAWTLQLGLDDLTERVCSIVRSNLTDLDEKHYFPQRIEFPRSWLMEPAKPTHCDHPAPVT